MKYSLIVLIIFLLSIKLDLYSQPKNDESLNKGKISGKIVDSDTLTPLPSATVSIYKYTDSTLLGGEIADRNGNFELKDVPTGKYMLKISYVGYKPKFVKNLNITKDKPEIKLGKIVLSLTASETEEVTVMADRQQMEYGFGKKVFNVDKDIVASGGNALDVLKNIPSVSVDVDGNVSLRGSSNLKILINGKPSTLFSSDNTALEQVPASMIDNIEVITNPSAKYDAEGTAGILNINLKEEKGSGLNGLISVNAGTYDRYNGSINLNYKLDGLSIFGSYDYSTMLWGMDGTSFRTTTYTDSVSSMNQNLMRRNRFQSHNVKGGFEYNFNPGNTLTFTTSYRYRHSTANGNTNSLIYDSTNSALSKSNALNGESQKFPNLDMSLNYRLQFDKQGHVLTADAFYSNSNHDEYPFYTEFFTDPYAPTYYQQTSALNNNRNYTIQSDYVHPFADSTKLEAGVKVTLKIMDSDGLFYTKPDSMSFWVYDTNKSGHFVYNEDVYAVYAIFSSHFGDFLYSGGLRLEQTVTKGDQKTLNQVDQSHYLDFFPSATLGYKLNQFQQIQFSYSRRIERPQSGALDPFVEYVDFYNVRYGNPNLKPQYVNNFELGLIQNFKKISITPSIFYNRTTDVFDRYTVLLPNGVIGTTWYNMSSRYSYGLEINFSGDVASWLRMSLDASYYKYVVEGNQNYAGQMQEDYSWNARLNVGITPFKQLSFQLTSYYNAPTINIQGKRFGYYSLDLGARYELADNLSLLFRAADIFHSIVYHNTSGGTDFFFENNMSRLSRSVSLGFQYKINEGFKQKEKPRNGEGGIEDDSGF